MKITDFKDLIQNLPDKLHAFQVKRENWKVNEHNEFIDNIFKTRGNGQVLWLNRGDLFMSRENLKEFIFLVLMWGYPTKGRGRNIDNLLNEKNLDVLVNRLEQYEEEDISLEVLNQDLNIPGLGLSTITKFTQFLDTTINGNRAVILDRQIIETIRISEFEELDTLKNIKYENAIKYYPDYIRIIDQLTRELDASHDQIEMFLFMFGRNIRDTRIKIPGNTSLDKELLLDIGGEGEGIRYYRKNVDEFIVYFKSSSSIWEDSEFYKTISPFYHSFQQLWSHQEIDIKGILEGSEPSFIHDDIRNELKNICLQAINNKLVYKKNIRKGWLKLID